MPASRIRLLVLSLFVLALVAAAQISSARTAHAAATSADAANAAPAPSPSPYRPEPLTVTLAANTSVLMACARDPSMADVQVRLNAAGRSPEGRAIRYRWAASGGRIIGDGPVTTWDLTGVAPGTYTATVEADSGAGCMAFSSSTVTVRDCPPPICPNITIYCPDTVPLGQPVTFTANVSGGAASITPVFNWTVSSGSIMSGQGTNSITVDTAGLGGQAIRVNVQVSGYGLDCSATCATQVPQPVTPRRFDEYGDIARDDEKARLDNFAIQLQNEPGSQGYILVYGGRGGRPGEAAARAARAREYLITMRGVDANRIVTQEGGTRAALSVELWVVPPGAIPPPLER